MDRTGGGKKIGVLALGEQMAPPAPPGCDGFGAEFEVNVIFTTWPGTQTALHTADEWARCLGARIVLWFPQVVPRQFSMTSPPVSTTFTEQRLQSLVVQCCEDLETVVRVCLCRDEEQCLLNVLEPESVVLVGGNKRWFHTREQKLATLLHSVGHRVLFLSNSVGLQVAAAPTCLREARRFCGRRQEPALWRRRVEPAPYKGKCSRDANGVGADTH